jgi:predicted  nucleic acid-binding Zn-ribbon protein
MTNYGGTYPAACEVIDALSDDIQAITNKAQKYQPAGSPPPGGNVLLVSWILESLYEENERLRIALDESNLSLTSSENATEVIQIMLEQSQTENAKLREAHQKIHQLAERIIYKSDGIYPLNVDDILDIAHAALKEVK